MSDGTDFFKRQIEEFIIKHPAAEGWRVYKGRGAALEHSLKTLKSHLKIVTKSTGEIKVFNGIWFSPQPGFSAGDVP